MVGIHTDRHASCAGEYSGCEAAPESLGFEGLESGRPPPVPYFGLNFTKATTGNGFIFISGSSMGQALFVTSDDNTQGAIASLSIRDSCAAAGGAFSAISVFVSAFRNGENFNVSISGSQNGTVNPSCQRTVPPSGPLLKVNLGASGGACVADDLSITTQFDPAGGTATIATDDFVVCKANNLSGLLPTS